MEAPKTGPVGELTVTPEMLERLEAARAQAAQQALGPNLLPPTQTFSSGDGAFIPQEQINPNGYSEKMKTAPIPVVSNAERVKRKSANSIFDFAIPELDDEYGPFVAKVKKPSILSLIESGTMPQNLRRAVDRLISAGADGVKEATEQMLEESVSESLGTLMTVANYLCVVGFVDPQVVATHEEATLPGRIHFDDIPHEARMRFWQMVQGEAEEMAEAVRPFPEQASESGDSRPDGGDGVVQAERHPAG